MKQVHFAMTNETSRIAFLKRRAGSGPAVGFTSMAQSMNGNPPDVAIGLQLYTVEIRVFMEQERPFTEVSALDGH